MAALSILDLVRVTEQADARGAIDHARDLARHAEGWGYRRFWVAEHHNTLNIASSATTVLMGHLAGATSTIRIGSGGIMLPNHAPLRVAEDVGTLATIYPDRIDLYPQPYFVQQRPPREIRMLRTLAYFPPNLLPILYS